MAVDTDFATGDADDTRERRFFPAVHCRGVLSDHWPHRGLPDREHPEKLAAFTGDFDGNPVADAS
jgi:hypothetical protein